MKPLRAQQIEAAAQTLAIAFTDDPVLKLLHPDQHKRNAAAPGLFATLIKVGLPYHQVWANDDASAVAVWLPPDGSDLSLVRLLRAGMALLSVKIGPRRMLSFIQAMSLTEPYHAAIGPHWYLLALGTRPERQGQGLGTALVDVGTEQADAAGVPCSLGTMTDEDISFYSKRGFEIMGQEKVHGFTASAMVRWPKQRMTPSQTGAGRL